MTVVEAMASGLLDGDGVALIVQGKEVTLKDAIQKGYIDPLGGGITFAEDDKSVGITEAFERGLVCEDGCIVDPVTGERRTLIESITAGLISGSSSVLIGDQTLSLDQAIKDGLIDPLTGDVISPDGNQSLMDALASGALRAGGAGSAMTMQQALEDGLFNEDTGKINHPSAGRSLSVKESIDAGLIDGNSM
jgi:hypothetical protein